ncbi:MAG TPA: hypothetical protein V6C72_11770, partial [Chroococcales cyanobacterium]
MEKPLYPAPFSAELGIYGLTPPGSSAKLQDIQNSDQPHNKPQQSAGGRPEHTLLGNWIGEARDYFSAPQSAADAQSRAEQNDDIAHVAADVMVAIPRMKPVMAGIAHSVLLYDSRSPIDSTVLNLSSGMLINSFTRSTTFGALDGAIKRKFGEGIAGSMVNNAVTGAGFAGLHTATTSDWHTASAAKDSAAKTVQSMAMGALINVPVGLASNSLSSLLSRSTSNFVASGFVSGAATGGLFSFTDTLARTHDLNASIDSMKIGAVAGALSGAGITLFERGRQTALYQLLKKKPMLDNDMVDAANYLIKPRELRADERIAPISLPQKSFTQWNAELPAPSKSSYFTDFMDPFAPGKFYSRHQASSYIFDRRLPAIKYDMGSTDILVPAAHAEKIEEVRQLRLKAEETNPLFERLGADKDLFANFTASEQQSLVDGLKLHGTQPTVAASNEGAKLNGSKDLHDLLATTANSRVSEPHIVQALQASAPADV